VQRPVEALPARAYACREGARRGLGAVSGAEGRGQRTLLEPKAGRAWVERWAPVTCLGSQRAIRGQSEGHQGAIKGQSKGNYLALIWQSEGHQWAPVTCLRGGTRPAAVWKGGHAGGGTWLLPLLLPLLLLLPLQLLLLLCRRTALPLELLLIRRRQRRSSPTTLRQLCFREVLREMYLMKEVII